MNVHFVSLGCPKNRVDTEVMLGHAAQAGHRLVEAPEAAEVIAGEVIRGRGAPHFKQFRLVAGLVVPQLVQVTSA